MQKLTEDNPVAVPDAVLQCENVTKIWQGSAPNRNSSYVSIFNRSPWLNLVGTRFRTLRKRLSSQRHTSSVCAIDNLSLTIERGELFVVIGPSGCGKTTLLKMLAGLILPSEGRITLNGTQVSSTNPECVLISQDPPLFPWLTAQKNVELMLKLRRRADVKNATGDQIPIPVSVQSSTKLKQREIGSAVRRSKAERILREVGLIDFKNAFPHQLSGGMQQRVAISCALVVEPKVVLMDEPFGALDAQTRWLMQQFLYGVWDKTRVTMVLVTHQIDEALFLADRILVMSRRPGRIKRLISVPLKRPRDRFSREFGELREELFNQLREEVGGQITQGEVQ